jgi:catechol-2,3-dioxygenase
MPKDFNMSRRQLLVSLPAIAMAPRLFAQTGNAPIRISGINHVTVHVSDLKRSLDFYQGLFGMPIVSRQGNEAVNLRIGARSRSFWG